MSATNVARAGKQGNICVSNNVSATMCPRLPGPIGNNYANIFEDVKNKIIRLENYVQK